MSNAYCPACGNEMERIECAPCYDCGHHPKELEHFKKGEHEYHVYEIYGEELVLCDFCDADFGLYYPNYLGLPKNHPRNYRLGLVRKIYEPKCEPDFYCKECEHRFAFIKFIGAAREYNKNVR